MGLMITIVHFSGHLGYDCNMDTLKTLFTVGYEGLNIEQFLLMLDKYNIEKIVDIRECPISRKAGFSKTALKNVLAENGFDYVHLSALGCPKPVRNLYKQNGDWSVYTKGFKAYVQTQGAVLEELHELAQEKRCALLCFEADAQFCHRSLVGIEMMRRYGMNVRHADVKLAKTMKPDQLGLFSESAVR